MGMQGLSEARELPNELPNVRVRLVTSKGSTFDGHDASVSLLLVDGVCHGRAQTSGKAVSNTCVREGFLGSTTLLARSDSNRLSNMGLEAAMQSQLASQRQMRSTQAHSSSSYSETINAQDRAPGSAELMTTQSLVKSTALSRVGPASDEQGVYKQPEAELDEVVFEALLPSFADVINRNLQEDVQQLHQQLKTSQVDLASHERRISMISNHMHVCCLSSSCCEISCCQRHRLNSFLWGITLQQFRWAPGGKSTSRDVSVLNFSS
jgi:hypothetical protein